MGNYKSVTVQLQTRQLQNNSVNGAMLITINHVIIVSNHTLYEKTSSINFFILWSVFLFRTQVHLTILSINQQRYIWCFDINADSKLIHKENTVIVFLNKL